MIEIARGGAVVTALTHCNRLKEDTGLGIVVDERDSRGLHCRAARGGDNSSVFIGFVELLNQQRSRE